MLGPWYVGDTPTTNFEVHVQRDGSDIEMDDYASAEVLLYNADGEAVEWDTEPTIDEANDVVIILPPSTSPFLSQGLHPMYLRLTADSSAVETFFVDYIQVLQIGSVQSWVTAPRVRSITGVTVTEAQLSEGQSVVELYAGRTFAGSNINQSIRQKDLGWREKAVAYQTAWQNNQPGYLNRPAIKEVNQVKNVSWIGTRTIKVKAPSLDMGEHPSYGDYKRNDDHPGWRPL
jgi:hypothetical protein